MPDMQDKLNKLAHGGESLTEPVPCRHCEGKGKISSGNCNCGSGEGCTLHNDTALRIFGADCPACKGTGKDKPDA